MWECFRLNIHQYTSINYANLIMPRISALVLFRISANAKQAFNVKNIYSMPTYRMLEIYYMLATCS